jgi:uncharacterized protein (DUF427 family)
MPPAKESVWDYPRPPRIEPAVRRVRIEFQGETVAESTAGLRVLETASPPSIWVPKGDTRMDLLHPVPGKHSVCEWKGLAHYFDLAVGGEISESAAFHYPEPSEPYAALSDYVSFYPGRVDGAFLGEERVRPQPGQFYAGWITDELEGPFKGEPGTEGW